MAAVIGLGICPPLLAQEAPTPLLPGPGEDVTKQNCNRCHTSDYIVMNSVFLTAEEWRAEVTKMRTAFGASIDDNTADKIVAYLAATYAVKTMP